MEEKNKFNKSIIKYVIISIILLILIFLLFLIYIKGFVADCSEWECLGIIFYFLLILGFASIILLIVSIVFTVITSKKYLKNYSKTLLSLQIFLSLIFQISLMMLLPFFYLIEPFSIIILFICVIERARKQQEKFLINNPDSILKKDKMLKIQIIVTIIIALFAIIFRFF